MLDLWYMAVVLVVAGYLLGSIPFGLLVARARGVDLRAVGSGNIGATNVARALGKTWGIVVLALDALKGFAPTFYAARTVGADVACLVALAAILGHVLPVWLRFRGGKGVATGLGVFVALAPVAAAIAVACYAAVVALTRLSSLGSLVGASALLAGMAATGSPPSVLGLGGAVWVIIVVKHRANIRRLIRGEESKV
jgi:acyl phosphate:glycerol-3-phosphate acyltransferase